MSGWQGWYNRLQTPGDVIKTAPTDGQVLAWDAALNLWVPKNVGTGPVVFAVASFSDGQTSPVEIGVGTWKVAGALAFSATYTLGPATAAHIDKTAPGWTNDLTFLTPFTSATSAEDVDYPVSPATVTFALHASKGVSTATSTHSVAFLNTRYWGVNATIPTDSAGIIALGNSDLVGNFAKTFPTQHPNVQYLIYCYPVSLGSLTSITVNGLLDTAWSVSTVSHTNASGFVEDYYVYASGFLLHGTYNVVVA